MKPQKEEVVRELEEFVRATDRFLCGVFRDGVVVDPETHQFDPGEVLEGFSTDMEYIPPRDREQSEQLALAGFEMEARDLTEACELDGDLRRLYTSMVLARDEAQFVLACLRQGNASEIAQSLQRRLNQSLGHCQQIAISFDPDDFGANSEAVVEKAGELVNIGQDVSGRIGALSSSAR